MRRASPKLMALARLLSRSSRIAEALIAAEARVKELAERCCGLDREIERLEEKAS